MMSSLLQEPNKQGLGDWTETDPFSDQTAS